MIHRFVNRDKKKAQKITESSLYNILLEPVITEKSNAASGMRQWVFKVQRSADKFVIKAAVEKVFDVKVSAVNILNVSGKLKRFRGVVGRRSAVKKAVVTLSEGHVIDFGSGVIQ